jgi:hypothetical protein
VLAGKVSEQLYRQRMDSLAEVRQRYFLVRFYPKIPSFCQDRLGTSIGKAALKNDDQPFSCLQFLRAKRFPYEVRKRVRTFYAHLYENKTVFDEKEILSQLPAGTSIQ